VATRSIAARDRAAYIAALEEQACARDAQLAATIETRFERELAVVRELARDRALGSRRPA
jgi:hypothetical protein